MGAKQNPNQAVPNKKRNSFLGPKIPSQAVQDKDTELHMTGHKKTGTKQNPNQAVPNRETELHMSGPQNSEPGSAR